MNVYSTFHQLFQTEGVAGIPCTFCNQIQRLVRTGRPLCFGAVPFVSNRPGNLCLACGQMAYVVANSSASLPRKGWEGRGAVTAPAGTGARKRGTLDSPTVPAGRPVPVRPDGLDGDRA